MGQHSVMAGISRERDTHILRVILSGILVAILYQSNVVLTQDQTDQGK